MYIHVRDLQMRMSPVPAVPGRAWPASEHVLNTSEPPTPPRLLVAARSSFAAATASVLAGRPSDRAARRSPRARRRSACAVRIARVRACAANHPNRRDGGQNGSQNQGEHQRQHCIGVCIRQDLEWRARGAEVLAKHASVAGPRWPRTRYMHLREENSARMSRPCSRAGRVSAAVTISTIGRDSGRTAARGCRIGVCVRGGARRPGYVRRADGGKARRRHVVCGAVGLRSGGCGAADARRGYLGSPTPAAPRRLRVRRTGQPADPCAPLRPPM